MWSCPPWSPLASACSMPSSSTKGAAGAGAVLAGVHRDGAAGRCAAVASVGAAQAARPVAPPAEPPAQPASASASSAAQGRYSNKRRHPPQPPRQTRRYRRCFHDVVPFTCAGRCRTFAHPLPVGVTSVAPGFRQNRHRGSNGLQVHKPPPARAIQLAEATPQGNSRFRASMMALFRKRTEQRP